MNFAEALMLFCNKFCQQRNERGNPVMLSEFANGITIVMIAMLDAMKDPEDRMLVREAIKSALDDDAPVSRSDLN
jgi:hypothetical protein